MVVFRKSRSMQSDDIRLRIQGIQIHIFHDAFQTFLRINVIGQYTAAKAFQAAGHCFTNFSGTDDTHSGQRELLTHFTLQGKVLVIRLFHDEWHIAGGHQYQHNGVVGHAVGRVGHMGDTHPKLFGMDKVDVVVTYASGRDIFDPQFGIAVQQLRIHGVRDDGKSIIPFGQICILNSRVSGCVVVGEIILPTEFLHKTQLIVFSESKEKDFHSLMHLFCVNDLSLSIRICSVPSQIRSANP